MMNYDAHTITVDRGRRVIEIKIPVPLSREEKNRLKQVISTLIELAIGFNP